MKNLIFYTPVSTINVVVERHTEMSDDSVEKAVLAAVLGVVDEDCDAKFCNDLYNIANDTINFVQKKWKTIYPKRDCVGYAVIDDRTNPRLVRSFSRPDSHRGLRVSVFLRYASENVLETLKDNVRSGVGKEALARHNLHVSDAYISIAPEL